MGIHHLEYNGKIKNTKQFNDIMDDLRKLPEKTDQITAYGCGPDIDDRDVLMSFVDAILEEEFLQNLEDDIVNAYYQLYSIDFQKYHEGIATFYENFYETNEKENVLRACEWLKQNGFFELSNVLKSGYESDEKMKFASDWIDEHTEEIYIAFRKIMFAFEQRYLCG